MTVPHWIPYRTPLRSLDYISDEGFLMFFSTFVTFQEHDFGKLSVFFRVWVCIGGGQGVESQEVSRHLSA